MLGRSQFSFQGAVTSTEELQGQKSHGGDEQGEQQHLQEPQLLKVKFHPAQQALEIADFSFSLAPVKSDACSTIFLS